MFRGEKDKRYKHLLNCIKEQRERQRKTEGPRATDFLSMLLLFLQLQPVISVMLGNSTTFTRYCVDTVRCVLVQRRSGFCLCPGLGDNSWALLSGLSLTICLLLVQRGQSLSQLPVSAGHLCHCLRQSLHGSKLSKNIMILSWSNCTNRWLDVQTCSRMEID